MGSGLEFSMTITQLQYFLKVSETLNISKASEKLFVSRQVVSKNIRLLEEELGYPLLVRDTKHIGLTKSGEILYQSLSQIEQILEAALDKAAKAATTQSGKVQVGTCEMKNVINYAELRLSDFCEKYPDIELNFEIKSFRELQNKLLCGELDLIFTLESELLNLDEKFEEYRLGEPHLAIIMSKKHPLSQCESIGVEHLKNEIFYIFSESCSNIAERNVRIHCEKFGFSPRQIKYFSNIRSMEAALSAGKGVTIAFESFFHDPNQKLKMFPIEPLDEIPKDYVTIVWNRKATTAVKELVRFLKRDIFE